MIAQPFRQLAPNLFDPPLSTKPLADFTGALAGALASIPQALAYGLIIGGALGSSNGGIGVLMTLYGSVVVGLIAVILGGCPFLIAGPRAATLLVLAALISQLAHSPALAHLGDPGPAALALGCTAVLVAGILKLIFGALQLGRLASYVPLQVVAGFMNGTALLVILSQVWQATGISPQRSFWDLFSHLHEIRPGCLLLALGTAAAILWLPRKIGRLPTTLLIVLAGTASYHLLSSLGWGFSLGGTLPPPPEHFSMSFVGFKAYEILSGPHGWDLMRPILLAGTSMAILSALDTLLATTAADGLTMRRSNANRQLIAEGLGNTIAGIFGVSPSSGSIVRTKAALQGGMVSAAAPIGVAFIMLATTLLVGSSLGSLPIAVMAGLLIALGIDLIDKWTLQQLRRLFSRENLAAATDSDLVLVGVVVATALLANLATAVGVGMLLSLMSFVMQMAHSPIRRCYPATALIPRIFGDIARRNFIEEHGKNIAVVEIEGALFFGTASELEVTVDTLSQQGVVNIVVDLKRVKHIDATGARALELIHRKLSVLGGILVLSHAGRDRRERREHYLAQKNQLKPSSRSNWEILTYLGTVEAIGEERFQRDIDGAVALCEKYLASKLTIDTETNELLRLNPSLLRVLDRAMLRRLRSYWSRISYATGETVFQQGNAPDGIYFVIAGRVDVMASVPGTVHERRTHSLTSGAVFGELALVDRQSRANTIVAAEPTICYWVSSQNFERLKHERADIALAILSNITMLFFERLQATNMTLTDMEA